MTRETATALGQAVTSLTLYAIGLEVEPTTQPIIIEETVTSLTGHSAWHVTFYGCRANGNDYQMRLTVRDGEILHLGDHRWWDDATQDMTNWGSFDTLRMPS